MNKVVKIQNKVIILSLLSYWLCSLRILYFYLLLNLKCDWLINWNWLKLKNQNDVKTVWNKEGNWENWARSPEMYHKRFKTISLNGECGDLWPVGSLQWSEANPQQPDLVARADDVAGVDPNGDLLDVLQILVELGQQPSGGVLLQPLQLTATNHKYFN